jgi:hypothetical protein
MALDESSADLQETDFLGPKLATPPVRWAGNFRAVSVRLWGSPADISRRTLIYRMEKYGFHKESTEAVAKA